MKQLFVDNYTLLRMARGIQARQAILDRDGSEIDADNALKAIVLMAYSPEYALEPLAENPNLNSLLISLLEVDLKVSETIRDRSKAKTNIDELIKERDELWDKYEVMRRIMAFDFTCLIVLKSGN